MNEWKLLPQMSHTRVTISTVNPAGMSGGSRLPSSSVAKGQKTSLRD